jgi:hypothetical protein
MATFEEIRLGTERTLAAAQKAEGENKRLLLRRLHRLIILADEAVSSNGKRSFLADNLSTWTNLEGLRSLVKIAMDAARAGERRPRVTGKPMQGAL